MKVDDYHDFSIHRWKSQKNTSKYFNFKDKEGKICCCTWIINTGNHPVLVNYLCDSCRMQKFSISQKHQISTLTTRGHCQKMITNNITMMQYTIMLPSPSEEHLYIFLNVISFLYIYSYKKKLPDLAIRGREKKITSFR